MVQLDPEQFSAFSMKYVLPVGISVFFFFFSAPTLSLILFHTCIHVHQRRNSEQTVSHMTEKIVVLIPALSVTCTQRPLVNSTRALLRQIQDSLFVDRTQEDKITYG